MLTAYLLFVCSCNQGGVNLTPIFVQNTGQSRLLTPATELHFLRSRPLHIAGPVDTSNVAIYGNLRVMRGAVANNAMVHTATCWSPLCIMRFKRTRQARPHNHALLKALQPLHLAAARDTFVVNRDDLRVR
jgi:hypothetical protein